MSGSSPALLRGLSTRDALLLAFFATFVVLSKAALRWHLHVPGHAMLATAGLLVLARICVPRTGAATAVGLLAGLGCAALGMGKGGPLYVLKLALPGAAVDAGAAAALLRTRAGAAAVGALAGVAGALPVFAVEGLAGVPLELVAWHAAVSAGGKAAFGGVGGLLAAALAERLREHGLVG